LKFRLNFTSAVLNIKIDFYRNMIVQLLICQLCSYSANSITCERTFDFETLKVIPNCFIFFVYFRIPSYIWILLLIKIHITDYIFKYNFRESSYHTSKWFWSSVYQTTPLSSKFSQKLRSLQLSCCDKPAKMPNNVWFICSSFSTSSVVLGSKLITNSTPNYLYSNPDSHSHLKCVFIFIISSHRYHMITFRNSFNEWNFII